MGQKFLMKGNEAIAGAQSATAVPFLRLSDHAADGGQRLYVKSASENRRYPFYRRNLKLRQSIWFWALRHAASAP